jgi:hypothetical protein
MDTESMMSSMKNKEKNRQYEKIRTWKHET